MNKFQYELLAQIKLRFLTSHGTADFQISKNGSNESARQFYLEHLKDNLIRQMHEDHITEYSRGSGSELDDKMKALRSSSAMTFNILGNNACSIKRPESIFLSNSYTIEYEYQLPTLKSGLPANLDALLVGDCGDIVACEMKMLEWLTSSPMKLKDKYLDTANYIYEDTAACFVETATELNRSDSFSRYDFAQMFKHSLALYNAVRSKTLDVSKIVLLNCVWEPPDNYELSHGAKTWADRCKLEEHAGFNKFKQMMSPLERLFLLTTNTSFEIQYLPADKLIAYLAYSPDERSLLDRYL